jgi:hypothetical protein
MKEMDMLVLRKVTTVVMLLAVTTPVWSQSTQPTTGQTTAPAADALEKVLPELRFDNVSFDEVANFLSDVTGMNVVVTRASSVPPGAPALTCHLRNVTPAQFFEFLQTAFSIQASKIEGPTGPIVVLRVPLSDAVQGNLNQGGGQGATRTEVFNLGAIIENLAAEGGKNAALNSVMSLIQTALAQTGGPAPTLKVHEGTSSLVFKGTTEQRLLVQSTIAALQPSREAQQRAFDDQLRERDNTLKLEAARAKVEIDALKRQNEQLEKQLALLREQLNTNRPATNP